MKILKALLIPCLLLTTAGAMAQPQAKSPSAHAAAEQHKAVPPRFFRLKFVLKEFDAKKIIDSRTYTTEISATPLGVPNSGPTETHRSIRADARVPVPTGPYQASNSGNRLVSTQFHYVNVGTDIDCSHPVIIGRKVALFVIAHISNTTSAKVSQSAQVDSVAEPIYEDNHWSSEVLVPIGQPAVLFTSQEPTSTRTLELDLTATPIH